MKMDIIVCAVPPNTRKEEFALFPGSEAAINSGCTCPEQSQWPEQVRIDGSCPVHELDRVAS
jgi:hypothetical protein